MTQFEAGTVACHMPHESLRFGCYPSCSGNNELQLQAVVVAVVAVVLTAVVASNCCCLSCLL